MAMTTAYIKFHHKDDVYAIDETYGLQPPGEASPAMIYSKCGDTLYIPVELQDGVSVSQPMGEIFRPHPRENPEFVTFDDPEPITLGIRKNLSYPEMNRLRQLACVAHLDDDGFEILIDGFSLKPVEHKCKQEFSSK